MKWSLAPACFLLAAAGWYQASDDDWVLVIGSSFDGSLAPCGCSNPMTGGIKRRATAIKALRASASSVVLEPGGFVTSAGRQDELKIETLAEALRMEGADASLWAGAESRLGPSSFDSAQRLAGGIFVQGDANDPELTKGPFSVIAIRSNQDPAELAGKARLLAQDGQVVVCMTDGDLRTARAIAQAIPDLKAVAYRSKGSPVEKPNSEGATLLVSAGDEGKNLVSLKLVDGALGGYRVIELGPDKPDDPDVTRAYDLYLERVASEGLLGKVPKGPNAGYVGSKACASCHSDAYETWAASKHAQGLKTLEAINHDADPDCVGCHVVGLLSRDGFSSRNQTPDLASVGCESCHGPGSQHLSDPGASQMAAGGVKACLPCHSSSNSPGFDFDSYWHKVIHR